MSTREQIKKKLLDLCNRTDFSDPDQTYNYAKHIKEIVKNFIGFNHNIKQDKIQFTRARLNNGQDYFHSINDLWYPKKVEKIGRGNFIQKPVFYCSNDPGTAIFEIAPKLNQLVTTLEVKVLKPQINLVYLGVNSINTPNFDQIPERDQGFHEFLEIIFREKIKAGEEYNYLKSAILVNAMLQTGDGVAYPSVGSNCKGWNVVFSTDFVDNFTEIRKIIVHKVIDIIDEYNLRIECLHKATDIENGNKIVWSQISKCDTHLIDESIYH